MRTNILTKTAATAAAATLVISGCSQDSSTSHDSGHETSSQSSAEFNQADVTYAKGMSMHHQQAVEMVDILLGKSGVDPDVEELAQEIKKAQGPEIKEMQSWLEDWGQGGSGHEGHGGSGSGHDMSGMVSPEDITKLKAADGERASALFLDQMIEHHEGAVTMAEEHRKDGENPEAVELSKNVITSQKAEIEEMRTMRDSL